MIRYLTDSQVSTCERCGQGHDRAHLEVVDLSDRPDSIPTAVSALCEACRAVPGSQDKVLAGWTITGDAVTDTTTVLTELRQPSMELGWRTSVFETLGHLGVDVESVPNRLRIDWEDIPRRRLPRTWKQRLHRQPATMPPAKRVPPARPRTKPASHYEVPEYRPRANPSRKEPT